MVVIILERIASNYQSVASSDGTRRLLGFLDLNGAC